MQVFSAEENPCCDVSPCGRLHYGSRAAGPLARNGSANDVITRHDGTRRQPGSHRDCAACFSAFVVLLIAFDHCGVPRQETDGGSLKFVRASFTLVVPARGTSWTSAKSDRSSAYGISCAFSNGRAALPGPCVARLRKRSPNKSPMPPDPCQRRIGSNRRSSRQREIPPQVRKIRPMRAFL